jgi:3-deoxy-D-arabino-heptulosonate 7-phosphate (DAHP) synthase
MGTAVSRGFVEIADVVQVGAGNMQNFLLKKVGTQPETSPTQARHGGHY